MQPKRTELAKVQEDGKPFPSSTVLQRQEKPALTHRLPARLTENRTGQSLGLRSRFAAALVSASGAETGHGLVLLLVPVMMGLGAGLFYMAPVNPPILPLAVGFLSFLLMTLITRAGRPKLACAAGLTAAVFAGSLAATVELRGVGPLLDSDVTTEVTGLVEARDFDAGGRVRYLIRLAGTADPLIRRPPRRVRLVARSPHSPLPVGSLISGRARLSAPSGPVLPGGYDFAFGAFVDGIGAHGFFYRAPRAVPAASANPRLVETARLQLRQLREHVSARIRSLLPGDPGGIGAALTVSDRRGISQATVEALRATGLAHILAISGLHMALAAGTLFVGLRMALALFPGLVEAWPVKKAAAIGAMLTATAYLLISGGSVPTLRAWIMLMVMLVAVLADRPALTMRNVALAAILIILISPSAVVGPGFQMSFAATAALISAYAALTGRKRKQEPGMSSAHRFLKPPEWLARIVRGMIGLAITSLVAGLATGLFSAHHFNRVAGNGLLANMLAMPLVTFVVMPSGLVAMLTMPFGLDAWPLQLMGLGLRGVVAVARYVHGLGGDLLVGQLPMRATVAAGAGFIVLVMLRSRLRIAGIALIAAGAVLALPPLAPRAPDILVSEDGRLIGLNTPDGLASNAARPSEFTFRQWQTALRGPQHLPPVTYSTALIATSTEPETQAAHEMQAEILDPLIAAAADQPSRFQCASRGVCAAIYKQATIIAIDRAELIGPACDRADLVIVAIPVYMSACRSGATLVTSRSLRRSGALAIRIVAADQPAPPPGIGASAATRVASQAVRRSSGIGARRRAPRKHPVFDIEAALEGVVRPWTVQRYYDWRTQSYDLPQ
ncbi:ComEC/Rec2 family competence protein [Hoeflea sp.]|uniref:ComEC/Rec2 family competence protein n=1 Tax=Hoeflea sp. TaxID=1940281 RepID=UPI003A956A46